MHRSAGRRRCRSSGCPCLAPQFWLHHFVSNRPGQAELSNVSVEPAEQTDHELALIRIDLTSQVSESTGELAAEVGEDLQLLIEGERVSRCCPVAAEFRFNKIGYVKVRVAQEMIDNSVDLPMGQFASSLNQL